MKPKAHWLFDIADRLEIWFTLLEEEGLDQIAPDKFPLERSHIGIKHLAQRIFNMRTFEQTFLSSAITSQRRQLIGEPAGNILVARPTAMPGMDGIMISDRAVVGGMFV